MRRFCWGFFVGVLVLIMIPVCAIGFGLVNMGASEGPGTLETTLASWSVNRSVDVRAPQGPNPFANDNTAIAAGLEHYKVMCAQCHAGPGIEPEAFAKGLNPPAPDLAKVAKDWTDGELFWISKHGIRMTGMPGFGVTQSDEDLWRVTAFVRKLDSLSEAERAKLREGQPAKAADVDLTKTALSR